MIGHIKIDRKILNWGWYTDHKTFHLFLYLLLKANHKDGHWKGTDIKRGQLITGRLKISKDTGLTEREIRTCLSKLKTTSEIAIKTTSKFSIVTICKYDVYQSFDAKSDTIATSKTTSNPSDERPASDQQTTINNNVNNDNNVYSFVSKGWPISKMPISSDFNGLPEIKIGSIVQFFKYTKKIDLTSDIISGVWESFKIQSLTGKKYYEDNDAVYNHFFNWVKDQKFEDGNKHNQSGSKLSKDEVYRKF